MNIHGKYRQAICRASSSNGQAFLGLPFSFCSERAMLLLLLIYSYAADTHISMTSLCVHTFSIGRSQDACHKMAQQGIGQLLKVESKQSDSPQLCRKTLDSIDETENNGIPLNTTWTFWLDKLAFL